MPNERIERVLLHYRRLGLNQGWKADRYYRLCRALECSVGELAAVCCVTERRMGAWLRDNRIPPYVALTLTCIESAWVTARDGGRRDPIIPEMD